MACKVAASLKEIWFLLLCFCALYFSCFLNLNPSYLGGEKKRGVMKVKDHFAKMHRRVAEEEALSAEEGAGTTTFGEAGTSLTVQKGLCLRLGELMQKKHRAVLIQRCEGIVGLCFFVIFVLDL